MSAKLEKEALEVAQWWTANKGSCTDVHKTLEFMMKANDHLLWVLGQAIQDIRNLEHREKLENGFQGLYMPRGVKLHDPISVRN